jgi:hypothetical protein
MTEAMLAEARRYVERVIADKGAFHVAKDAGLFAARKGA